MDGKRIREYWSNEMQALLVIELNEYLYDDGGRTA